MHEEQKRMGKRSAPLCGAKTRKGTPCCRRVVAGRTRCENHGGLSTGPRTPEGRAKISQANKERWSRIRQEKAEAERARVKTKRAEWAKRTYEDFRRAVEDLVRKGQREDSVP